MLSIVLREPTGVVGMIMSWNFPFPMVAWKLAPTPTARDCIVLKSFSSTSLSVFELMKAIGDLLPPGMMNIIFEKGSKSGQHMLDHSGSPSSPSPGPPRLG